MKNVFVIGSLLATCAVVTSAAGGTMPPMGTPLVAIGEGQPMSWSEAMGSGRLRGVNPEMDGVPEPARQFYATQGNAAFVPSVLTPDVTVDLDGESHQSLLMQWNPLMQGEDLAVAAWQYDTLNLQRVGGLDLRGGWAHFTIGTASPAIWDFSFELQDKNGLWCSWFRSMPATGWAQEWIDFGQGNQGGWLKFGQAGFDLSNVTAFRVDAAANPAMTFPPPPFGGQTGLWDWTPFRDVVITPTPGSAALLGVGLLLTIRRRRAA